MYRVSPPNSEKIWNTLPDSTAQLRGTIARLKRKFLIENGSIGYPAP
jgi:hypothetical protein